MLSSRKRSSSDISRNDSHSDASEIGEDSNGSELSDDNEQNQEDDDSGEDEESEICSHCGSPRKSAMNNHESEAKTTINELSSNDEEEDDVKVCRICGGTPCGSILVVTRLSNLCSLNTM
jgi:hypothetical protein